MCKSNDEIANEYDHLTAQDYPIAYRARKWFFCGLPFYINESVLVPRMDTEILVAEVIKKAGRKRVNILDLCTGSGCIAIALAKKVKNYVVYASDISGKALRVARKNARMNKVKIAFSKGDLFENIFEQVDIIVCNPPYIKNYEIGKYDKSILHEPRIALDGGEDGLGFYRRIIAGLSDYLVVDGLVFFEVGDKKQCEEVKTLLQEACFSDITIVEDKVVYARQTC